MEDEGKGGKARDAAANNVPERVRPGQGVLLRNAEERHGPGAQEGTDYYATPEPIGLKMVSSPTSGQEMMFWSRPPGMVPLRDDS